MLGTMTEGQVVTRNIRVVKGQRVRVALAWSSHTSGTSNFGKTDVLRADLDLVIRQPNGTTTGSFSFDNSYEVIDVTASSTGTMRISVEHDRFDASQEPFGLAWSLQSPYTDIEGSKYYGQILWVAQRSIMAGCTSTRFCPDGSLTRGQLAKSLAEALDLPPTGTDFYSDDESSRFEGAINRLTAAGLTGGCGGGKYCPGQTVRRGALATALARALHLPATGTDFFTDDESSPHEANINRIAAAGITSGCADHRYCPDSPGDPRARDGLPAQSLRLAAAWAESTPFRRHGVSDDERDADRPAPARCRHASRTRRPPDRPAIRWIAAYRASRRSVGEGAGELVGCEWKIATRSSPAASIACRMRTRSAGSTSYRYGLASRFRARWTVVTRP